MSYNEMSKLSTNCTTNNSIYQNNNSNQLSQIELVEQVFKSFYKDDLENFSRLLNSNQEVLYISDSKLGDNIFHIITRHKAFRILKYLVSKVDLKKYSRANNDGNSFVHLLTVKLNYADQALEVLRIDFLYRSISKFNYKNKNGLDLVNLAAERGNTKVLLYLVECGLAFHSVDERGNNALANALVKKNEAIVKFLIEKGAEVFADEYQLKLLVADDDPDYIDLALSVYAENHSLKTDMTSLDNLYHKLKDLFGYCNAHHCLKVLEDFYTNFKQVKYISQSDNTNKTVDISDINTNTCELTLTKKLEHYIKVSSFGGKDNNANTKNSNMDYNEYFGNMRKMSMHEKGYNYLKAHLNCKLLTLDKITDLNELYESMNSVIYTATYYFDPVIIKVSKADDTESMKNLLIELNFMAMINHMNVLQVLGWFEFDSKLAIVYPYIEEGSLFDYLYTFNKKLTFQQKVDILMQISKTLFCLHESYNLIHKDIKSSNILIDKHFHVYICDFGMSNLVDRNAYTTTATGGDLECFQTNNKSNGDIVCTVNYMAPEYLDSRITHRKLDCYAFGILLWEVMAETKPYDGMSDIQIIYQVMSGRRPDLKAIDNCYANYLVIEQLKKLIENCWCNEYKSRMDMDQIYLELKEIYENVKI